MATPVVFHAVTQPSLVTGTGLLLASVSGAVASGCGYALWYAALPHLPSWRAATLQLTVPALTALAATLLLSEALTPRLTGAMALVLLGIWLTVRQPRERQPAA